MDLFLRTVRQNKWYPYPPEGCDWLPDGVLHADPLGDLGTIKGTLSVWRIADDESDEHRVIAAIASGRESLQVIDYIVFCSGILRRLDIEIEHTNGISPDSEISQSRHYNMIQLSAKKLVEFAEAVVIKEKLKPKRATEGRLKKFIQDGVSAKQLDPDKMKAGIRDKLDI